MVNNKDSESESDGMSSGDEARVRISVCMRRVHCDHRARAYVSARPRRRLHWLYRRLRARYQLPRAFHLLCRGHLLHPREPLALLERDDLVEVIPVSAETEKTVQDEVDSVVVAAELNSSLPEVMEDLEETKRRALLMLDQYRSTLPLEEAVDCSTRPRRRRVRRRRRAGAKLPGASSGDEPPLELESQAMVLRNDLQPRAPRVVRPLSPSGACTHDFASTADILA
ncbi:uncharacterized protein LOC111351903 [Spodoptera litura]|uniref:Uncharacterized protein LOC111351903 n=1 Tax=Spodoptera litura TaxID=69820 RepID=A0A9J7E1L5_SPOLT|nr:uncharacterized protein LOC111351903 [Spodoptera litura]